MRTLEPTTWPIPLPRVVDPHEEFVFLFFAPTRTKIVEIRVPGGRHAFESTRDPARVIWVLKPESDTSRFDRIQVVGYGDPPGLLDEAEPILRLSIAEEATSVAARNYDDRVGKMLDDRAKYLKALSSPDHVAFARYDAWSDPTVRAWLGQAGANLLHDAQRTFGLPPALSRRYHSKLDISKLVLALHDFLFEYPSERGRRRRAGLDPLFEVTDGDYADWFRQNKLTADQLIALVAQDQRAAIDAAFPVDQANPRAMDRTVALFSVGGLRNGDGSSMLHDRWLNFEPDSAQFFLFGEFFSLAYGVMPPSEQAYWYQLASLFVALQPHYCAAYLRPNAPKRYENYRRRSYRGGPVDVSALLAAVDAFRKQCPTIEAVRLRAADHAADAFREG